MRTQPTDIINIISAHLEESGSQSFEDIVSQVYLQSDDINHRHVAYAQTSLALAVLFDDNTITFEIDEFDNQVYWVFL